MLPCLVAWAMGLIAVFPIPSRCSPPPLVRVNVSTPAAATFLHEREVDPKTSFSLEDDEDVSKKELSEKTDMR